MPGMVAFRRRWSVGSDDLVVPALFLIILHSAWILVLALIRVLIQFDDRYQCTTDLRDHIFGYVIILGVCVVVEIAIAVVSLRGSILSPEPRRCMEYLLYARLVLGMVELAWLIVGAVWSGKHYETCQPEAAKKALLGIMICNWLMVLCCVISVWCTYDTAGAKWVKMKKYQDSMKERRRNHRRQSGSRRNWRQRSRLIREFFLRKFERKAFRAYEESWDRRLQLLCCCVERKGRNKNSMSEIAQLFTEFFRDLDVVPSDIVAGLVLLRHHQKHRMKSIIAQGTNDVYQYLSGVPVTPTTRFLQLTQAEVMGEFIKVIHYMRYALAAYGWPVYVMMNPGTWLCRLLPALNCCCCCGRRSGGGSIVDDNCCGCNVASLKNISGLQDLDIIYATYHVDIGETPFFVALDHEFGKVVVCVRGTLSLQDVLTDLKAEPETLPLNPPRDDWQGHKGMVQAALYIKKKLIDDKVLDMAWERDEEYTSSTHWLKTGRDVAKYDLVCVGHSLGAGTAAILAILLKADYPTLHCYSFSPPGGLLTLPCVEETKSYITSVVVGKDVVPRIGLPQLEMLRTDIINLIKSSRKSKWNIISKGFCCCSNDRFFDEGDLDLERDVTAHPSNSAIGLSAHTPLYPPGNMIHVVRSHVPSKRGCQGSDAIYQALWASNGDFDEVLVSPTMINDHMPDNVLESLEKVLQRVGPQKPVRTMTQADRRAMVSQLSESSSATPSPSHAQGFLETSFTSPATLRHPPGAERTNHTATGSWDIAAQQILQAQDGPNGLYSASMPSSDESTASVVKPLFSLPLSSEPVHAPLASPETLSVASGIIGGSMASGVADVLSQGESVRNSLRRSLHSPPSRNSYRNSNPNPNPNSSPPARIEGVHVELSPGKGKMRTSGLGDGVEGGGREVAAGKAGPGAEEYLRVERLPHDSQSECRQTDPSVLPSNGAVGNRAPSHAPSASALPAGGSRADQALSNAHLPSSAVPLHNSCPAPGDDSSEWAEPGAVVMTIGERWAGIDDPHECMRHSPVETNHQGEYEHPNLHYSQASTGYPHGAYHPPIRYYHDDRTHPSGPLDSNPQPQPREVSPASQSQPREDSPASQSQPREESPAPKSQQREESPAPTTTYRSTSSPHRRQHTPSVDMLLKSIPSETESHPTPVPPPHPFVHCQSESSIFSKHFPPKLGMKRSAEQRDICHLEDEAEVYPPSRELFTIKRSAEQRDIPHLGDDLDVFEEETEDIVGHLTSSRGRLTSLHSTPRSSTLGSEGQGYRQGAGSQHASSSHSSRSDDVFEPDLAQDIASETDV